MMGNTVVSWVESEHLVKQNIDNSSFIHAIRYYQPPMIKKKPLGRNITIRSFIKVKSKYYAVKKKIATT